MGWRWILRRRSGDRGRAECAFKTGAGCGVCSAYGAWARAAESTYVACLKYEMEKRGLREQTEVAVPVVYDGKRLVDVGYRMDMLVNGALVVEAKKLEAIAPVHKAQLLSYLKHSGLRLGLLINFKVVHLRDGIVRQVNGL